MGQRDDGDARETRERTDGKSIIMPAREMAVKRPTYAKDGLKSINARGCIIEFVATMTYVALCVPVQMLNGNGFTTAVTYAGRDAADVRVPKGNGGADEPERVGDVYGHRENHGGANDREHRVSDRRCAHRGVLDVRLGRGR